MTIQDLPRHIDLKMTMTFRLRSGQVYTYVVNRPSGVGHSLLHAVTPEAICGVRPAARRITLIPFSSLRSTLL